jgi:hypothetical protein
MILFLAGIRDILLFTGGISNFKIINDIFLENLLLNSDIIAFLPLKQGFILLLLGFCFKLSVFPGAS